LREQLKRGRISLRDFYIRRTLRIWPLYYVTLALYIVLVLVLQRGTGRDHVFFHYLPGYLTFTYTWFAGWEASGAIFNFAWSLSVEEQFYLIWAGVLRVLRGTLPVMLMCLLIGIRAATEIGAVRRVVSTDSLAWRMAAGIAVPICLGAILAQMLHSERWFLRIRPLLGHRWAAPLFLLVLVASLAPPGNTWEWVCWPAACLLVGACVIREDNGIAWFLRWKFMAYIGVVSYGMYMLNTLVLDCLKPMFSKVGPHHPLLQFPIALACTVFAAGLSYRFLETPFLRLKERFSQLRPPKSSKFADVAPVAAEQS
jgi:peptidoglycan/LPS O-acetylase OafA/YrhL